MGGTAALHDSSEETEGSILEAVRSGSAFVAGQADLVRVDEARLDAFARNLLPQLRGGIRLDPTYFYRGDRTTSLAYVVTFNSVLRAWAAS